MAQTKKSSSLEKNDISIAKKAMLASLKIKIIGMSEIDRKATRDANAYFQTSINAGNYQRCKIQRSDIKIAISAAESARKTHNRLTRPWNDAYRMLPAALTFQYTSKITRARQ